MPEIRRFLIQTCGAVKYLHHRNIVHRDLKTGNIFLDEQMNVKVGDFGLAAVLVGKNDMGLRRTTMCGTPNYLAPEILEKTGKGHNEKVDLWAIGIIAYVDGVTGDMNDTDHDRYTLAVGKAPFHAAKREEIYKKLQNREYQWPDLSKHQNDISNDLRDLVGSLLVDEDDRPNPDQIVSHPFFKVQFVPEQLDSICTSIKPVFKDNRPPTAETIRRGYSDGWFNLCKTSGVGEYVAGRFFPVVGLVNSSVVKDVEREIKAGKAPSVPIAQGTVYLPFISERKDKSQAVTSNLSEIAEESSAASSGHVSHLVEISANDRMSKPTRTLKHVPSQRFKENMPPAGQNEKSDQVERPQRPDTILRRVRSYKGRIEETQKAEMPVALPRRAQRIPSNPLKSIPSVEPPVESPIEPEPEVVNQIKVRPTRPTAKSRTASREEPEPKIQIAPVRPVRSRIASKEEKIEPEVPIPPVRPRGRLASREKACEEILPVKTTTATVQERPIRSNTYESKAQTQPEEIPIQRRYERRPLLSQETQRSRREERPAIVVESIASTAPESTKKTLSNTDPTIVLARATRLHANLLATLTQKSSTIKGKEKASTLPFVTKWVDYAKKHGIGYILSNGTVGCIFNATTTQPMRHVLIKDGSNHLNNASNGEKGTLNVSDLPLEFFSVGAQGSITGMEVTLEMRKTNGLLWAKFARYMCANLSSTNDRDATVYDEDTVLVRYYQRLGSAGIWGYSNGCFQINFPDHTKLVISADGKSVSFTCLPLEGIAHLERTGDLPMRYVRSRSVVTGSTAQLLHDSSSDDSALARANSLVAKLQYLLDLIGIWIEGGGLGCKPKGTQWPRWSGLQLEEDGSRKVDWITVGKLGHEAVVVEKGPDE
jgi:myosin I